MKHFLKIADFDVAKVNKELEQHPELWDAIKWRKEIPDGPHARMSDIWVRYNDQKNIGPQFNDAHSAVWYPAYWQLPSLKKIIFDLMYLAQGERLGGVLITRIPHGCGIDLHVDRGWHVETFDKFYISLRSELGAKFICYEDGQEVLEPRQGECWRFDNRKPHSVENESGRDRVTLIVCIETLKYKNEDLQLARAA